MPRPPSAPNYRWGDGAEKAIEAVGLGVAARGVNAWHKAAVDRGVWREVVAGYGEEKNKKRNSEGYWREINPSSGIVPLWHTGPVAISNGAAQALQAVIPPYSWSVRCPRSMRWVYISLVMIF